MDLAKASTSNEKKESERLNRKISEINNLIRAQEANSSSASTTSLYQKLGSGLRFCDFAILSSLLFQLQPTVNPSP